MIDFLASLNLSVHLTALPFETVDDVKALFPAYMREDDGEVFEALCEGLLALLIRRASDQAEAGAQASAVYAEDAWLDRHGQSRDKGRAENESDEEYRTRILRPEGQLSPTAIMAGVKAILAPFTDADPWYAELPDDDAFIFDNEHPLITAIEFGGVYLDVDEGISADERLYGNRPYSRPRHWFLWGSSTVDNDVVSGNLYGHALIGIPAFPVPNDADDEDDDFFFEETDGAYTFEQATLSTYPEETNPLYAFESEAVLVVERIQRFLSDSMMFPSSCDVVLDPTLEA